MPSPGARARRLIPAVLAVLAVAAVIVAAGLTAGVTENMRWSYHLGVEKAAKAVAHEVAVRGYTVRGSAGGAAAARVGIAVGYSVTLDVNATSGVDETLDAAPRWAALSLAASEPRQVFVVAPGGATVAPYRRP